MPNTTVPPLRMEVKFRNNIILRLMEESGFKTVAELCRAANLSQVQVGELINMKVLPLNKDESWRPVVNDLATFFNCLPEDMFTEEQLETVLATNRGFAELTFGQVHALIAANEAESLLPEKSAEKSALNRLVEEILGTLTLREEKIMRLRFGIGSDDHTLAEIADKFNLSHERIRQIETKAMRKLRHPKSADYLRQFLGGDVNVDEGNYDVLHPRLNK